jgi:hypothetical protein
VGPQQAVVLGPFCAEAAEVTLVMNRLGEMIFDTFPMDFCGLNSLTRFS